MITNEADFIAHFVALNEHLQELRPLFDAFCARHGFLYVNRQSLGRYPRIRIEKARATTIWFDLSMGFDSEGNRFEQFRRDLPYDFGAGAFCDLQDGSKYGVRFGKIIECFSGKPFDQIGSILCDEMKKFLPTHEQWDVQYLATHGTKVTLQASESMCVNKWDNASQQPFTFEEWGRYFSDKRH